jgi:GT2 family glycosyltransferase
MPQGQRICSPDLLASAIVVGFNGREMIARSLPSLIGQDMRRDQFEILYIDNASSDGSADYVEATFPEVRVVRLAENLGFYAAFDWAARELTQSRYVVAVPQDALLHSRWLAELAAAANADPRIMACVTNTVPERSPDYQRRVLTGEVVTATRTALSRLGYVRVSTTAFDPEPSYTLAAAGVSMLVRRDLQSCCGLIFDPAFSHYAGDVELGLRAFVLGGATVHVPTAIVYHLGEEHQALHDWRLLRRFAEGSRDNVLALYKNMTTAEFVLFAPLLTVGLALKSLQLRAPLPARLILLAVALPLSPFVGISAALRFRSVGASRRALLSRRRIGRFGLLRAILTGRAAPPEGEVFVPEISGDDGEKGEERLDDVRIEVGLRKK